MPVVVGFFVVMGSILTGYTMHGGSIKPLIQVSEFIIIGGACLGSVIIGYGFHGVKITLDSLKGLLSPKHFDKHTYMDFLKMVYVFFTLARKEGILALERHVESPETSEILQSAKIMATSPKLLNFFCDSLRLQIQGGAEKQLENLMDGDLDIMTAEANLPAHILQGVGDALPGFGIVAAVLGVVITMQGIDGPPAEIGHKVAAALVGTFLGVLLAYGIFNPLAAAVGHQIKAEEEFFVCVKTAVYSFSEGCAPKVCLEMARRQIPPASRPGFIELENELKSISTT
ncbi:MAG: flagellar motor stator protein MotA [Candidatus Riflebacteria bacterium]|nr:flagellar motor stator protein MotA [Candidatus Riflebacteria bacterium]